MIRILVYPIGGPSFVCYLEGKDVLAEMQPIVGGLIQPVDLEYDDKHTVSVYCNEEGLLMGLAANRVVGSGKERLVLLGTLFLSRTNEDGETVSLTDEDIRKYKELPRIDQMH